MTSRLFNTVRKAKNFVQASTKRTATRAISSAPVASQNVWKLFGIAALTGAATYVAFDLLTNKGHASSKPAYQIGLGSLEQNEIPPKILEELKASFLKYASINEKGQKFMSLEDFEKLLALNPSTQNLQLKTLFQLADKNKDGKLDLDEFVQFELIMTGPEADYKIAFQLFDTNFDGVINFSEFKDVIKTTRLASAGFNFNCDWIKGFFGNDLSKSLSYVEFTQLLKGFEAEVLSQAFQKHSQGTYSIPEEKLEEIFLSNVSKRVISELPEYVRQNLKKIAGEKVTYSQFVAFYNVLKNLDRVEQAIIKTTDQKQHPQITKKEFMRVARRMQLMEFTPMEVDYIFRIFDKDGDGLISLADYKGITVKAPPPAAVHKRDSAGKMLADSAVHFALGSVAGAIGAFTVYPIDLVKTRMQNQRNTPGAPKLYNNSWDCFVKVLRGEGVKGLYKGLIPQLIGVAPEKAIKLTVNDLLRNLFGQPGGQIYFPLEVLAGGSAGASQVIFTNPIEIVKIRLQTQGEAAKFGVTPKSTMTIVKELGLKGLYKGAPACLLRDIPFSAIYFPAYASCKQWLTDPAVGSPTPGALLLAGALAGIPAASLVTPADVIKTRLQVEARKGQQTYSGIADAAVKIWHNEGFKAFWKGAPARVFRSSPQFGVTLFSYELLQRAVAPGMKDPRPPTNAPVAKVDYYNIHGQGGAQRSLRRVDQRWGLFEQVPVLSSEESSKALGNKKDL